MLNCCEKYEVVLPLEEYNELLMKAERIDIVRRLYRTEAHLCTGVIKAVLNIEEENENETV